MKPFLDDDFLLQTKTASYLYHNHAAPMPVIDYHCHLSPEQLALDRNFANISQAWLHGDHYKWRAMRANGIPEYFITGNAPDREKFMKWAETVPYTLRNPLYHWTHLELLRYFGIRDLLSPLNAASVFEMTSAILQQENFRPLALLSRMKVEVVCTTDDPVDNLAYHGMLKESGCAVRVIPAWRPDKVMAIGDSDRFRDYLEKLSESSGITVTGYATLLDALQKRHDYFSANGCRLSDHGISVFPDAGPGEHAADRLLRKVISGGKAGSREAEGFMALILHDLAVMDHRSGWTQQYHIGALRNNCSRLFRSGGPDAGGDSIGDHPVAEALARFMDRLDREGCLARTILYNLNPSDNEVLATMAGNFQDGSMPGKIQYGSAWWFLDQKDGMEKQLNCLSNHGLLSRFIGMLTDSRSLLSYPRHEYFRRLLCNLIGRDVENGEIPADMPLLGKMIEDICYFNARNYFNF